MSVLEAATIRIRQVSSASGDLMALSNAQQTPTFAGWDSIVSGVKLPRAGEESDACGHCQLADLDLGCKQVDFSRINDPRTEVTG